VEAGRVPDSPAAALARLPEHFAALVEARLQALGSELGHIEDEVLTERFTDNRKLGALRRELSRYAREFSGLKSAIHRAMSTRHGGLTSSPLLEQLPPLMQDVEDFDRDAADLSGRARLIYEEIETRIGSAPNRSLAALTVASTLLLPPTLVAGWFGMNVPGLPWAQDKEGFWIVVAFAVCSSFSATQSCGDFVFCREHWKPRLTRRRRVKFNCQTNQKNGGPELAGGETWVITAIAISSFFPRRCC